MSRVGSGSRAGELAGLTSGNAVPARNKTVRLFPRDLGRLGTMTGWRVSEANVIRAAPLLEDKAEPDVLLAALKDFVWE